MVKSNAYNLAQLEWFKTISSAEVTLPFTIQTARQWLAFVFVNHAYNDCNICFPLKDPDFVNSYDYGDNVYFFFREFAVEYINCGKVRLWGYKSYRDILAWYFEEELKAPETTSETSE